MCSICLEEVDGDAHRLECGHAFHPACLIGWLRQGNLSCPNCRDDLRTAADLVPQRSVLQRAEFICRTIGRRHDRPRALTLMMNRLERARTREREVSRELREHGSLHRDTMRRARQLRMKKWRARTQIMNAKRLIGMFDCPELTLPALVVRDSSW